MLCRLRRRDRHRLVRAAGVGLGVDDDAEVGQALAQGGAQAGVVLTDAGGEGDGVQTSHDRRVRAHVLGQAVQVDVHGVDGVLVALVHHARDLTHVRLAGQALHAGLAVEQVVDLVDRHTRHAHEMEDGGRVDVAGAPAHDQVFQRGQAHGGLDRARADDGRHGGAVAQVQDDLLEVVSAQALGDLTRDVLVARYSDRKSVV